MPRTERTVSEEQRPTFRVAVVGALPGAAGEFDGGPDERRAAARLADWLDRATARASEHNRLCLVTFTHGPGSPWAMARNHSIILVPRLGGTAVAERELVEFADALVVVGDPAKWARLVRVAGDKGIPVRYFAG